MHNIQITSHFFKLKKKVVRLLAIKKKLHDTSNYLPIIDPPEKKIPCITSKLVIDI